MIDDGEFHRIVLAAAVDVLRTLLRCTSAVLIALIACELLATLR